MAIRMIAPVDPRVRASVIEVLQTKYQLAYMDMFHLTIHVWPLLSGTDDEARRKAIEDALYVFPLVHNLNCHEFMELVHLVESVVYRFYETLQMPVDQLTQAEFPGKTAQLAFTRWHGDAAEFLLSPTEIH